MAALIVFWISFFFILYTYLGYPGYLILLSRFTFRPVQKQQSADLPFVSVVIAAKNEEQNIRQRLHNLLQQDYPSQRLEIIVVSDGSTDNTCERVEDCAARQQPGEVLITCYACPASRGKPAALNLGIEHACGEIVVFADARQKFETDVLTELVANFSDPVVGAVSGELLFVEESDSTVKVQMGAYWKYEKFIRRLESATGSVVGATGAVYAVRKELYRPLPETTLLDDVLTPMNIVMQGKRVLFDSRAIASDVPSKDIAQEWKRKVRTLAGNWQLLSLEPALLNPARNPVWFRFLSHKVARLFVPLFLVTLLLSGALLPGIFYRAATVGQVLFYLTALTAAAVPGLRRNNLVQLVYFFCALNLAAVKGFIVWVSGECDKIWVAGRTT